MARKTKEEAEETRESVLLAALDLFSEKGYSRTTCSDIARRIGMTRGAVYWHFENKAVLLAALIDFMRSHRENLIGFTLDDIHTIEDLRRGFISYARIIQQDELSWKFEFFMNYQMDWSEELLTETHKKLNEIRQSPLEDLSRCFEKPSIACRLRPNVDLANLVLTLGAFWSGMLKIYLGGCPGLNIGREAGTEMDVTVAGGFDLEKRVGGGFDLIMQGVLNEEIGNE